MKTHHYVCHWNLHSADAQMAVILPHALRIKFLLSFASAEALRNSLALQSMRELSDQLQAPHSVLLLFSVLPQERATPAFSPGTCLSAAAAAKARTVTRMPLIGE